MEYIDVFSGIGGIGVALSPFIKPILYCEWDKYCQQVLVERMRDGSIDKAPIHADIKTLHISPHLKPRMIGGGFPCQDISTAGAQLGMAGDRSSLFFEIMRLVDESPSIEHVFLENVANIVKCGLQEVLEELKKRGFDIVWTTRSAASMGAPHQRSRWFCLASKRDRAKDQTIVNNNELVFNQSHPWATDWPLRITIKNSETDPTWDPNWIARSHTLGNTVVPCVVRSAYLELKGIMEQLQLVTKAMAPYAVSGETLDYPFPESGILTLDANSDANSNSISSTSSIFVPLPTHRQTNPNTSQIDITIMHENRTIKMGNYPTLRRGITHPSNVTERSMHDLPTVLCNTTIAHEQIKQALGSDTTPDRLQGLIVPNVNYLEWMMGYPKDWTRVKTNMRYNVGNITRPLSNQAPTQNAINKLNHVKRPKNCMHLFMQDTPGKDVRQVALLWRDLDPIKKLEYKQRAADLQKAIVA